MEMRLKTRSTRSAGKGFDPNIAIIETADSGGKVQVRHAEGN